MVQGDNALVHPGSLRQPGYPCEGRGGEVSTLPSLADNLRKVMAMLWGPSLEAEDGGAVQKWAGSAPVLRRPGPTLPLLNPWQRGRVAAGSIIHRTPSPSWIWGPLSWA